LTRPWKTSFDLSIRAIPSISGSTSASFSDIPGAGWAFVDLPRSFPQPASTRSDIHQRFSTFQFTRFARSTWFTRTSLPKSYDHWSEGAPRSRVIIVVPADEQKDVWKSIRVESTKHKHGNDRKVQKRTGLYVSISFLRFLHCKFGLIEHIWKAILDSCPVHAGTREWSRS
jgi:hypothetical protein